MRSAVIGLVLTGLSLSPAAWAEKIRCDGKIVETGMQQEEVLRLCGQPDEMSNQTRISWTYHDWEGGRMKLVIYFYANGEVEAIETVHD